MPNYSLEVWNFEIESIILFMVRMAAADDFSPCQFEIDRRFFGPSSHLPPVGATTLGTLIFRRPLEGRPWGGK